MSGDGADPELLHHIEDYVMDDRNFGIDPQIFAILNDMESSKPQISATEKMMDVKIALRLRSLARSAYYSLPQRSKAVDFYDVILALGMHPAQVFILAMALFSRLDERHKRLEVESYAVSMFARLIAETMNMNGTARERAKLGGLLLQMGRVVIALYEMSRCAVVDPAFVEANHRHVALKIVERFDLPEFLSQIIAEDRLLFARRGYSVSGVVYLAQCLVQRLLDARGILEIKSPMPEVAGNLDVTPGSRISDYFHLIGLQGFLKITVC